jgi:hypothetical protein
MEVKYFKMKHKVLINSSHGQIWVDLEEVSLKISGKIGDKKNSTSVNTRHIREKLKKHKSIFR